jgi:RNA polymerase sigma factor (sigma-70 family)
MPTLEWREQIAALYLAHQPRLRRQLAALVNTTPENIEDACMFAWMQLLTHQLEEPTTVGSWLLTVARREAIKLDQRRRRSQALHDELEAPDPVDRIGAAERRLDTAAVIAAAGLSARGRRLVALQAAGLSYREIAEHTGDSVRTVERQLLRARRKLEQARSRTEGELLPSRCS